MWFSCSHLSVGIYNQITQILAQQQKTTPSGLCAIRYLQCDIYEILGCSSGPSKYWVRVDVDETVCNVADRAL